MRFNPDPEEFIFVKKLSKPNRPSLNYNNMVVIQSTTLWENFGYYAGFSRASQKQI